MTWHYMHPKKRTPTNFSEYIVDKFISYDKLEKIWPKTLWKETSSTRPESIIADHYQMPSNLLIRHQTKVLKNQRIHLIDHPCLQGLRDSKKREPIHPPYAPYILHFPCFEFRHWWKFHSDLSSILVKRTRAISDWLSLFWKILSELHIHTGIQYQKDGNEIKTKHRYNTRVKKQPASLPSMRIVRQRAEDFCK